MELVPLAKGESLESVARGQNAQETAVDDDHEQQHDFMGNEILSDRIPYSTIYDGKTEVGQRGYFIPGYPVTVSIVKAEKRQGIPARLTNPYLYTIDLEHGGPYKWTIKRQYKDFQRLSNSLKIFRAASMLTAPFQRNVDETVLMYTGVGPLVEAASNQPLPELASESKGQTEGTPLMNMAPQMQMQMAEKSEQRPPKSVTNKKIMQQAKRRQAIDQELPDFPSIPDVFISQEKLEQRKARLESYLSEVLKVKAYRDHPETTRFLEVSRLSFVNNLGSKNKEGKIELRPRQYEWLGPTAQKCCMAYCRNWTDIWLTVKDSFIALIDHRTDTIRDVMLFDKDFDVYTESEYPGDRRDAVRKSLFITNGKRYLRLKCDSVEDAITWKNEMEDVTITKGSTWNEDHRFLSSFPIRDGVYAQWLVDGSSFMEHAANIIELAREDIFIADFTLNVEIFMKRPIVDNRWRLDMLLKRKADDGVRIFVLLYREVPKLFPGIGSYATEVYLASLSPNIKVLRHPDISAINIDYSRLLWAHHEKLIIIDQKIAFVSGIDLCYGRWDDHNHRLVDLGTRKPDSSAVHNIERDQNEVVSQMRQIYDQQNSPRGSPLTMKKRDTEAPKKEENLTVEDILNMKYERTRTANTRTAPTNLKFDISGRLWPGKDYQNLLLKDLVEPEKALEDSVDRTVIPRMPWHDIGCVVYGSIARDVARHFIHRWNSAKVELSNDNDTIPFLMPKSYENVQVAEIFRQMSTGCNAQVLRSSGYGGVEMSICNAYLKLIEESEHFIYIENQFFISKNAGVEVLNEVSLAIFNRIVRAHKNKQVFRVYVMMPLLPGYMKTSGAMQMELNYTYLTISKGPGSLLKKLKESVGDPSQYITFCSLRTHAELLGRLVTEVLYVHTKMILVDDRKCLIGSANINDRSQLGKRDSEVAVLIEDTWFSASAMNGQRFESGAFAGSLRRHLFQEYLGILSDTDTQVVNVDDPVSSDFYEMWKSRAAKNAEIYEKVFDCIPSDNVKTLEQWAQREQQNTPLADTNKEEALKLLKDVQGFLVAFSTEFLADSDLMTDKFVLETVMPSLIFT